MHNRIIYLSKYLFYKLKLELFVKLFSNLKFFMVFLRVCFRSFKRKEFYLFQSCFISLFVFFFWLKILLQNYYFFLDFFFFLINLYIFSFNFTFIYYVSYYLVPLLCQFFIFKLLCSNLLQYFLKLLFFINF